MGVTLEKLELYYNMKFLIAAFLIVSCVHAHHHTDCGCPHDYDPVCGKDGHTIWNRCYANCQGEAISCTGECPCKAEVTSQGGGSGGGFQAFCRLGAKCPVNFGPTCLCCKQRFFSTKKCRNNCRNYCKHALSYL